jgi:integrase
MPASGSLRFRRCPTLGRGSRPPDPVITRKGGKVVTIPLAPRTARAIDLAIGERTEEPLFVTAGGNRLHRHGAVRILRRVTRRAGISKRQPAHPPLGSSQDVPRSVLARPG